HQTLLAPPPRNRPNVPSGHFALLRCSETTSKDREVAASHHGDTPYSGNSLTSVPVTPYTTYVDVNLDRADTAPTAGRPASQWQLHTFIVICPRLLIGRCQAPSMRLCRRGREEEPRD